MYATAMNRNVSNARYARVSKELQPGRRRTTTCESAGSPCEKAKREWTRGGRGVRPVRPRVLAIVEWFLASSVSIKAEIEMCV